MHNKILLVNNRPVNIFRFTSRAGWATLTLGHGDQPTFEISVPLSFYDLKTGSIRTGGQLISWANPH